jgi:hypothetical protein
VGKKDTVKSNERKDKGPDKENKQKARRAFNIKKEILPVLFG